MLREVTEAFPSALAADTSFRFEEERQDALYIRTSYREGFVGDREYENLRKLASDMASKELRPDRHSYTFGAAQRGSRTEIRLVVRAGELVSAENVVFEFGRSGPTVPFDGIAELLTDAQAAELAMLIEEERKRVKLEIEFERQRPKPRPAPPD
jgi:hypothetical protein